MSRLRILMVLVVVAPFAADEASAQDTIKIGAVQSMTGSFNPIGKQVMAGARLYLQEHAYTMAGKKIEILLKDDTSLPDIGKRLAQELGPPPLRPRISGGRRRRVENSPVVGIVLVEQDAPGWARLCTKPFATASLPAMKMRGNICTGHQPSLGRA